MPKAAPRTVYDMHEELLRGSSEPPERKRLVDDVLASFAPVPEQAHQALEEAFEWGGP